MAGLVQACPRAIHAAPLPADLKVYGSQFEFPDPAGSGLVGLGGRNVEMHSSHLTAGDDSEANRIGRLRKNQEF